MSRRGPIKRTALKRQTKKYGKKKRARATKRVTRKKGKKSVYQQQRLLVPGQAACGTYSNSYGTRRRLPKALATMLKSAQRNNSTKVTVLVAASSAGSQGVQGFPTIYNREHIVDCYDATTPSTSDNKTQRIVLLSTQMETVMTNQGNNPAMIDIYDCVARRDMPYVNTNNDGNSPIPLWYRGMLEQGLSDPPNPVEVYGIKPFQSTAFTQNWKITKVTTVTMPQGTTHRHTMTTQANQVFTRSRLDTGDSYFKGLSRCYFTVQRGYPADTGLESIAVSTTPVKIDCITTLNQKWAAIPWAVTNTAYATDVRPPGTDLRIMNVGDGQAEAVTYA